MPSVIVGELREIMNAEFVDYFNKCFGNSRTSYGFTNQLLAIDIVNLYNIFLPRFLNLYPFLSKGFYIPRSSQPDFPGQNNYCLSGIRQAWLALFLDQ